VATLIVSAACARAEHQPITPTVTSTNTEHTIMPPPVDHSSTPQTVQTQNYNIQVDPIIRDTPSQFRTIEQDKLIILAAASHFPFDPHLIIKLVPGANHRFIETTDEITIGRDLPLDAQLTYAVLHERSHEEDPEINKQYLASMYSPEQIAELAQTRQEILSDPLWGDHFGDLDKIFSATKSTVAN